MAEEPGDSTRDGSQSAAEILLVDDTPANLLALEAVLGPTGHLLVSARSGEEALQRLLARDFGLIILDVMMPGLDGFETAALIRQRPRSRHTPIIFITASTDHERHVWRAYGQGAADYVTKPFDPEMLRAKVSVFVELHRRGERLRQQQALLARQEAEAREREAARRAAELANQAKDEFLAMLSHELRAPLAAILGWVDLLDSGRLDEGRRRRAIEVIRRSAHNQNRLIEDLIDLSQIVARQVSLDLTPVRLDTILAEALEAFLPQAEALGVALEARIPPCTRELTGDAARLGQVATNLVANSLKFTPRGGRVTVSLVEDDDGWTLSVADTGCGISAAFLPRVFDRFQQESRGPGRRAGLGIGLSIAQHMVEAHGGTIEAHSDGAGRGATFVVRLPSPGRMTSASA